MSNQYNYEIESILKNIRSKRKQLGYSCENMADDLKISIASYHKLEKGKTRMLLSSFLHICNILKINPSSLLNKNDQKDSVIENVSIYREYHEKHFELYKKNLDLSDKLIKNLEKRIMSIENGKN